MARGGRGGFSLVEGLIVVALTAVMALMVAPYLGTIVAKSDVSTSAASVVDALREAQSAAMSHKDGGKFGVHFQSGQFTYFATATYSAGDSGNVVHAFNGEVSITGTALTGGVSDIRFQNHRGTPDVTGTVTLQDSAGNTKTVSINAAGMIDTN